MPIYPTGKRKDSRNQYRVIVNYTDTFGKHRTVERLVYGMAEAKDIEASLQKEVTHSVTPRNMTVSQLYDEYMIQKKQETRETTYDKTRRNLEYAVLPLLGSVKLDRLTGGVLQKWKNEIGERPLKDSTKQNYFKEFSALLNYAVKLDYIPQNPLKKIGNFRRKEFGKKNDMDYYTPEEYLKFQQAARTYAETAPESRSFSEWAYFVFFSIAFYTGMRKGEINALRWKHIKGNVIEVRRTVSQKVKGKNLETEPKTFSSVRDLVIPDPLMAILEEHKKRQMDDEHFSGEYYVCGAVKILPDTTIEKHNEKYRKAAGLKHIRIHDFRHTHATVLINERINIMEICRRLGHRDIKETFDTYAHLYPREEGLAVGILNVIK